MVGDDEREESEITEEHAQPARLKLPDIEDLRLLKALQETLRSAASKQRKCGKLRCELNKVWSELVSTKATHAAEVTKLSEQFGDTVTVMQAALDGLSVKHGKSLHQIRELSCRCERAVGKNKTLVEDMLKLEKDAGEAKENHTAALMELAASKNEWNTKLKSTGAKYSELSEAYKSSMKQIDNIRSKLKYGLKKGSRSIGAIREEINFVKNWLTGEKKNYTISFEKLSCNVELQGKEVLKAHALLDFNQLKWEAMTVHHNQTIKRLETELEKSEEEGNQNQLKWEAINVNLKQTIRRFEIEVEKSKEQGIQQKLTIELLENARREQQLKIEKLQAEIDEKDERLTNQKQSIDILEDERHTKEQELLQEFKSREERQVKQKLTIELLENARREQQLKIEKLQAEIDEKDERLTNQKQAIDILEDERHTKEQELLQEFKSREEHQVKLKNTITKLYEENNHKQQQALKQRIVIEKLNAKVEDKEYSIMMQKKAVEKLKAHQEEIEHRSSLLENTLEKLKLEIEEKEYRSSLQDSTIEELKLEILQKEQYAALQKNSIQQLKVDIEEKEHKAKLQQNAIEKLEAKIEEMVRDTFLQDSTIEELKMEILQKEQYAALQNNSIQQLKVDIEEKEHKATLQQNTIEKLEAKIEEIVRETFLQKKMLEKLQAESVQKNEHLTMIQEELRMLGQKYEELLKSRDEIIEKNDRQISGLRAIIDHVSTFDLETHSRELIERNEAARKASESEGSLFKIQFDSQAQNLNETKHDLVEHKMSLEVSKDELNMATEKLKDMTTYLREAQAKLKLKDNLRNDAKQTKERMKQMEIDNAEEKRVSEKTITLLQQKLSSQVFSIMELEDTRKELFIKSTQLDEIHRRKTSHVSNSRREDKHADFVPGMIIKKNKTFEDKAAVEQDAGEQPGSRPSIRSPKASLNLLAANRVEPKEQDVRKPSATKEHEENGQNAQNDPATLIKNARRFSNVEVEVCESSYLPVHRFTDNELASMKKADIRHQESMALEIQGKILDFVTNGGLDNWPNLALKKEKGDKFVFGTRRIRIKLWNGDLMVQVGRNQLLDFYNWIEGNAPVESRRMKAMALYQRRHTTM